jgi:hypothetical protein
MWRRVENLDLPLVGRFQVFLIFHPKGEDDEPIIEGCHGSQRGQSYSSFEFYCARSLG